MKNEKKSNEIERMIRNYCKETDCMECPREENNNHPCFTLALNLEHTNETNTD